MSNLVERKTLSELEAMHTGTLMNRRKALLKCDETPELSRQNKPPSTDKIEFKNTAEWQQAYQELKAVLSTRENIPNKQQRKAIRQAKAKRK